MAVKQAENTKAGAAAAQKEAPLDFSTQCSEASGTVSGPLGDILFLRSPIQGSGTDIQFRSPMLSMLRGMVTDIDQDSEGIDGGLSTSDLASLQDHQQKGPPQNLRGIGRHGRLDNFFKISTSKPCRDFIGNDVDGAKLGNLEGHAGAHWWYDDQHTGPILYDIRTKARSGNKIFWGKMLWDAEKHAWRPMVKIVDDTWVPIDDDFPKKSFSQYDVPRKPKTPKKPEKKIITTGVPKVGDGEGALEVRSKPLLKEKLLTITGKIASIEQMFYQLIECKNTMVSDIQRIAATVLALEKKLGTSCRTEVEDNITEVEYDLSISTGGTGDLEDGGKDGPMEKDLVGQSMTEKISGFTFKRSQASNANDSTYADNYVVEKVPGTTDSGNFVIHLWNDADSIFHSKSLFPPSPFID